MAIIDEIVEHAIDRAQRSLVNGNLNLKSVIYQAVQAGMAEAYARGMETGKSITAGGAK